MPSSVSAVTNPTLADLASRLDPKGRMAHVIEVLTETNEILDDMTMMRGNLPFGHKSTIRTGLPKATWRKFYQGVNPTKSTTAVVTDNCGMLEAYSEVDYDLYEQHGSQKNVFRMDEDSAHIEGMNQQIAEHLFYGDEVVVPQSFTGFFPRYNTLNENVPIARYVFSVSGTAGDNGSIFICNW